MEKNEPTDTKPPEQVSSTNLETGESLEGDETPLKAIDQPSPETVKKKKQPIFKRILSRLNIYLLLFILIVVLAAGLVLVGIQKSKKAAAPITVSTQQLSKDELNKLKGTDSSVGDAKQTLNIQSNAVFSGKVLIKDSLDVAGTIKVGGALNLPGITVSGISNFDQILANKLTIAGDSNVNGQLTVQKGLTVTGGASFGGPISAPQLTVQSLQLNSDLQINKHIDAGGPTPNKSDGNGLGGGGTTSISGTDIAGAIVINFGSGALSSSCYINITFTTKYPDTPNVVIGATSAAGAQLKYYAMRSSTGFQICSAGGTAGGSATFDYIVVD